MGNINFVCYHITTEDRLDDILKEGLKPNSNRNRSAKPAPYIMLSLYPKWDLFKGFKKNVQPILVEICSPAIKRRLFYGDPEGLAWDKLIKPEYFKSIVKFQVVKGLCSKSPFFSPLLEQGGFLFQKSLNRRCLDGIS